MANITVIMYHYIRKLKQSRFPLIKGLELSNFSGQLDYLQAHYNIISPFDLMECLYSAKPLPKSCALLTFDDGYLEHFTSVFPMLMNRRLSGCFFPPAEAILERKLLIVNKIHILLAALKDFNRLIDSIKNHLLSLSSEEVLTFEEYWQELTKEGSRFDPPEIIFVKRLLQVALPVNIREKLVDQLLREFVKDNEATLAEEFYVTPDQLQLMASSGMMIGSHGWSHSWLGKMDVPSQIVEIEKSLSFLSDLGVSNDMLSICYPYGSASNETLTLCKARGFKLGFSTEVRTFDINKDDNLWIPRLDTNDLPSSV